MAPSSRRKITAYEVLGVSRTCTRVELKKGYASALKRAHPDKGGSDEAFERVQKAYQVVLRHLGTYSEPSGAPREDVEPNPGRQARDRMPPSLRNGAQNQMAKPTYFATQAKARGNRSYAEGKFEDAAAHYTEALSWLPGESTLYCNRSAAFFELGRQEQALRDATKAASISPRYVKAHYRRALALSALGRHAEALASMRRAHALSPSGGECDGALLKIEKACSRARLRLNLSGHSEAVQDSAWRPGGGRPVLATCSMDGIVRLWCGVSGISLGSLAGHRGGVTDVFWSPDGLRLVSLSLDTNAIVWDMPPGVEGARAATVLEGHGGRPTSARFAELRDGTQVLITSSTDRTARVWDFEGGSCIRVLSGHGQMVTWADYSSEAGVLATTSADNTFRLWDLESGRCDQCVDWDSGAVNRCAFVRAGGAELLVTCHLDVARERSRVLVWDAGGKRGWADGKLVSHVMHFENFRGKITCVDWAGTEESVLLAAGCADGTVRVFDLECKASLYDLVDQHLTARGSSGSISALSFSPSGARLATAGWDGKIHVWDAEDGAHLMTFVGHEDRVCFLRWDAEGRRLASGGVDKTTKVWNMGAD